MALVAAKNFLSESKESLPANVAQFKQEIKDRANLHNIIYIVIMLLSTVSFPNFRKRRLNFVNLAEACETS